MRGVASNWTLAVALAASVAGMVSVFGVGAVMSSPARAVTPGGDGVVRLDGPDALAELRSKNPTHYALAIRIMAEANHLCKPTTGQLQHTRPEGRSHDKPDAQDPSCEGVLLSTSNPPKRRITFTLDHTVYIATVTVTDDPPRLAAADATR